MYELFNYHPYIAIFNACYLEYQQHSSGNSGEWVLTDFADSKMLGTEKRIMEKQAKLEQLPKKPARGKLYLVGVSITTA